MRAQNKAHRPLRAIPPRIALLFSIPLAMHLRLLGTCRRRARNPHDLAIHLHITILIRIKIKIVFVSTIWPQSIFFCENLVFRNGRHHR